eukprot:TRINITY_DN29784_c0_g1_i1.p1 TRINITY_DN29784_c0_g1~~TRINITY_DN29784_c0_g1_i1.p1  ORF type:complete len:1026 (+),score=215.21 TRINITY_DN29784_c0_g1_i1:84-3161(+)
MFDFGGTVGGSKVSMGGARGRQRTTETRAEFLKRQQKERNERESKRTREQAAALIQRIYRGWKSRKVHGDASRALFDKRVADIAKVENILSPEQLSSFIFRALLPMLRLFVFFFISGKDATPRLAKMLEMVLFSGRQSAACNVLHLVAADGPGRMGFLILLERLIRALLLTGNVRGVADVLQLLQQLCSAADATAAPRCVAAAGHLLRRTDALHALSGAAFLLEAEGAASPEALTRASDLALLCSTGCEMCAPGNSERYVFLACLLSTPRLWEELAGDKTAVMHKGLPQLAGLMPLEVPPPAADDATRLTALLEENVAGCSRWAWLVGNSALVLRSLLSQQQGAATPPRLKAWLAWLRWAKTHVPVHRKSEAAFVQKLAVLHGASVASALFRHIDAADSHGLMPSVLELYFPSCEIGDDGLPPADVRETLAFSTPFLELIFPSIRFSSAQQSFDELTGGKEACETPIAARLRAFCAVYGTRIQAVFDFEFFSSANPLSQQQLESFVPLLNYLAYRLVRTWPDRDSLPPGGKALRVAVTSLVRQLYRRHLRKPILPEGDKVGERWIMPDARELLNRAPVVDLGTDAAAPRDPDAMDVEEDDEPGRPAQIRIRRTAVLGGDCAAREVLEAVLEEVPHVLPFQARVELLHNVIMVDQENRLESRLPWVPEEMRKTIRRSSLVEDGFAAFSELYNEDLLRAIFKVEFIGLDGQPESGIDGGGLFKEFMIHICRSVFDPTFTLFSVTDEQTLYPAPQAFRVHRNAAELYKFMGKVVGKAVYEMMLLEAQFSRIFLNRITGRTNEIDDVAALDKELHRGMVRLKENERVEDLGLTFSISSSASGRMEDIDLIPNGRNIAVTKENLTHYLHVVANFRTNLQMQRHASAFVQGLQCVIPVAWLKMFDPYELNTLISGSTQGFDVGDLRKNTHYGGGYNEESPVVQWLWALLARMDATDMGKFLMFITSCSRPPLLGFQTLTPKFCIHRVPDADRLPTASTCANLLKLPDYPSPEVLETKVLQAIRAESGFDLS